MTLRPLSRAVIRPGALRHNISELRKRLPAQTAMAAVVKTDGYGHGMLTVARIAIEEGCQFLAVASVEEAAVLREHGFETAIAIVAPILPGEAEEAVLLDARVFVGSLDVARALGQAARRLGKTARVHLKIDTGMGRFGLIDEAADLDSALEEIAGLACVEVEGAATHFSQADEPGVDFTADQAVRFRRALARMDEHGLHPRWVHAANSGGVVHFPQHAFNLVRPGIAMYGVCPGPQPQPGIDLEPVMSLETVVADLRRVQAGVPVSYGRTFVTKRPSRLAVLPVGYGNGFPRHASNACEVVIRGRRVPLVGRVTMNLTVADVTDLSDVAVGDPVLLFGRRGEDILGVEELAAAAGTISYEILCNVGRSTTRVVEEG
ncbi:alanine racemase [bacterium]|nr:alanine racemase [bacterium]